MKKEKKGKKKWIILVVVGILLLLFITVGGNDSNDMERSSDRQTTEDSLETAVQASNDVQSEGEEPEDKRLTNDMHIGDTFFVCGGSITFLDYGTFMADDTRKSYAYIEADARDGDISFESQNCFFVDADGYTVGNGDYISTSGYVPHNAESLHMQKVYKGQKIRGIIASNVDYFGTNGLGLSLYGTILRFEENGNDIIPLQSGIYESNTGKRVALEFYSDPEDDLVGSATLYDGGTVNTGEISLTDEDGVYYIDFHTPAAEYGWYYMEDISSPYGQIHMRMDSEWGLEYDMFLAERFSEGA